MKSKSVLTTGAIICCLTVVIGAFGAHALRPVLEANDRVSPFETGVLYQMFHGLALLALGLISQSNISKYISRAYWCFLIGVILFSGSLYGLAIRPSLIFLGPVTPIGGLFFILGWLYVIVGIRKPTLPSS